jgi:hypothetical protein
MKKQMTLFILLVLTISVSSQTGGQYNLEQNVIGNGGWRSEGGSFVLLGTMGQANSGSVAVGGQYHLIDGLWATENIEAGSPYVAISGRAILGRGTDVGAVRVLLTAENLTTGVTYWTYTGPFGEYALPQVTTGANYRITVSHRQFTFDPSAVTLFIDANTAGLDFIAAN